MKYLIGYKPTEIDIQKNIDTNKIKAISLYEMFILARYWTKFSECYVMYLKRQIPSVSVFKS